MKDMKARPIILLAALFLAGCTRTEIFRDGSLTATIDCGINATKAILIDNPGYRLDSRWQDAESIGVFGDGASNVKFSVSGADISKDGKTAKFKATSAIPGGALTAYSPYQADAKVSGSDIVVTIPAVQKYITSNGVVQPDPIGNIMAATGSANSGLTFRNAMAVLKIGQVFDKASTLKKVEFRDLSGAAVCGSATLSWHGGSPEATVVGDGTAITLDCGDGIEFAEGQVGIFFIIVPAREYPKGFELTFIDSQGGRTVKTAGAAKGKKLDRSIVYLIGDVSANEVPKGATSTLKSTTTVMTPEIMDNVVVRSASDAYVTDENGNRISFPGHSDLRMPRFDMIVPKEINPAIGNYLIFDNPTDELPNGGVYKIVKCNKLNDDSYEIVAYPEINVAAPFEDLKAGEPLISETGEIIEDGGIPLDLASYVYSIKDANGKAVQFSVADDKILLSEETIADMLGVKTKAVKRDRFSSPKLSLNRKEPNLEVSVGGYLSLDTRLAVRYMQGEFQYMQFTVTPEITTSLSAVLKAEGNIESSAKLYTIAFLPILVAPAVLVCPEIVISAKIGVGGSLQISGSFDITQELGTYSLAYNKGDGGTLRWNRPAIENDLVFNPSFGGIEGSLYAFGGIGATTFVSLYGMCGLGLENYLTFKFGTSANSNGGGLKLFVQPEFEVTPSLCFAFGSKKFEDLTGKVEFDPIWESYIIPESRCSVTPKYNMSRQYEIEVNGCETLQTPVPTNVKGIDYTIKLEGKCAENLDVALLVFKGSGIELTPQDPSDPGGSKLAYYRADGVEHLYGLFYMNDKKLVGISEKPDSKIIVGTYPAGTESMTFEGTATGNFDQGQAYGVVPAIISGGNYWILDRGGLSRYYNPFIYWWPNRSNGAPYNADQQKSEL